MSKSTIKKIKKPIKTRLQKKSFSLQRAMLITTVAVLVLAVVGKLILSSMMQKSEINLISTVPIPASSLPQRPGCTKDVSSCPDGSRVGRTGPDCQFVCPKLSPSPTPSPSLTPTPSPTPSLVPSPSPSSNYGLKFFSTTNPCGTSSFMSFKYTCMDGRSGDSTGKCVSITSALDAAYQVCGLKPL